MIPVHVEGVTDFEYHLPGKPGEGLMPCFRDPDARCVTTLWRPEPDDDRTLPTCRAHYHWPGLLDVHAGVVLEPEVRRFGQAFAGGLRAILGTLYQGGVQFSIDLEDQPVSLEADQDALVAITVIKLPPPAVSVWLDDR